MMDSLQDGNIKIRRKENRIGNKLTTFHQQALSVNSQISSTEVYANQN